MQNTQNFEKAYNVLNAEQKNAVDSIYGPVMVVAWPGTGKTQIMALRAANIILKTWVNPGNILITTFTEAGIISLKKRLFEFIWADSYKINVSTIHSFCNDVISDFPEKFLSFRAFKTIDDIEQIEILEHIIDLGNYEALSSSYDKYHFLRSIKDSISKLKQEWIDVLKFGEIIEEQKKNYMQNLDLIDQKLKKYTNEKEKWEKHILKLTELNNIYAKYLQILNERWLYDFSDMIDFVLKKLKEDQNLRLNYAEKYQFIMIDEYQDTNNAQNEIIDLILSESDDKNVMVVGDDDQSIYRFQWANLENMLYFSKKYEATKFVVLKQNYRSTQWILDTASKSINYNKSRISNFIPGLSKELNSNKKFDSNPELFICKNDIEEKAFILDQIKALVETWEKFEDIAIIVRTNSEVESFSDFLQTNSIPVESKLKSNILKSKFVSLLLSLLEVVVDPLKDDSKLANILRSPISDVNKLDILLILRKLYNLNYKPEQKKKLFELISNFEFLRSISKPTDLQQAFFEQEQNGLDQKITWTDKIEDFVNKILDCQVELSSNFYNFFKTILEKFNFIEFVEKNWNFSDLEDIFTLLNYVKKLVELDKEITPEKFFKKIGYFYKYNLTISRNILKSSVAGVQIMTAHQSKWLEFENVFIPSILLGNWGSRRVIEKIKLPFWIIGSTLTEDISKEVENEEERRLFFVSLTRAKKKLSLSFPTWIDNKAKLQSEFLQEIELVPKMVENINLDNIFLNEFKILSFDSLVNKEEELYINEFLKNYKLSASDLNKFIEDPRLFLRDVIFKYPFEDNEFTIFGKVYHKTLEYFYLEFKKSGNPPDKTFLEKYFIWLLNKEILSKDEFERLKEKWITWLNGWYDSKIEFKLPLELEYNFRSKNIVFDWIPLTGKIDKIELFKDDEVILVDYKTGKAKSLNDIKWLTQNWNDKYFRQLLFYKIMFSLDNSLSSKYKINSLAIEFVEWKESKYPFVNVEFNEEDLEKVENEIKEVRSKINDLNFWRSLI